MIKVILLLTLILLQNTLVSATTPVFYRGFSLTLHNLLPFSEYETTVFKSIKVSKVKVISKHLTMVHMISDSGLVLSTLEYGHKEASKVSRHTFYRYNDQGRLITVVSKSDFDQLYDSLGYDEAGRIIYYLDSFQPHKIKRNSGFKMELRVSNSNDSTVSLIDNTTKNRRFVIDNKNRVLIREWEVGIDSVSVEENGDTSNWRYWHRPKYDSIFYLERIDQYNDEKLLSQSNWTSGSQCAPRSPRNVCKFYYDDNGKQIQKVCNPPTNGVINIYNRYGLVDQKVYVNSVVNEIVRYSYFF